MTQDEEQLRLLAIFHYVVAGLAGLFALFPIFHLIFGLIFIFAADKFQGKGEPPPAFIGWFFVIFAAALIIFGWVFAGLVFMSGRFLGKRKHYLFCIVMAGVVCAFMPFGTVLGVFTIIVLMRGSVKRLFGADQQPPLQTPPGAAVR
jgi:hypothetical protein